VKNYARSTAYNIRQRIERLTREEAEFAERVNRLAQEFDGSRVAKFRRTVAAKKLNQIRRDLQKANRMVPFNE
jgi:uncharacterized protein (UPF0335 family)